MLALCIFYHCSKDTLIVGILGVINVVGIPHHVHIMAKNDTCNMQIMCTLSQQQRCARDYYGHPSAFKVVHCNHNISLYGQHIIIM